MNFIKTYRLKENMSLKELGQKVGVSESTISKYESGLRTPSYDMLLKLSEALHIDVPFLTGDLEYLAKIDFSTDEIKLINLYRKASDSDKNVIRLLLEKYK